MGKDTVVIRSEVASTVESPFIGQPEKVKDYFQENYGECEVIHSTNSPQPSGKVRYVVVLKFTDSPTANRIKQKYNGRVLSGSRVTTCWLEAKQMNELGLTDLLPSENRGTYPSWRREPSPPYSRYSSRSSGRSSYYREYSSRYSRSPSPDKSSSRDYSPSSSSRSRKKVSSSSSKERSSSQESQLSDYTVSSDSRSQSRDRSSHDRPSSRTSQLSVKERSDSQERSSSRASNNSQSTSESDKKKSSQIETRRMLRTKRRYDSEDNMADSESDAGKKDSGVPERKRPREDPQSERSSKQQKTSETQSVTTEEDKGSTDSITRKEKESSAKESKQEKEVSKTRDRSPASKKDSDGSKSPKHKEHSSSKHKHKKHKEDKKEKKSKKADKGEKESAELATNEEVASESSRKSTQSSDAAIAPDQASTNKPSNDEEARNLANAFSEVTIKKEFVAIELESTQEEVPPTIVSQNEGTAISELSSASAPPSSDPPYDFERDETPPAELLEATHHLAPGNYAEWYHWTIKNNPSALEQLFQQIRSQGDANQFPTDGTAASASSNAARPEQMQPSALPSEMNMQASQFQSRSDQQDVHSLPHQAQQLRQSTEIHEQMHIVQHQEQPTRLAQWNERGLPYPEHESSLDPSPHLMAKRFPEPVFAADQLQSRNEPMLHPSRAEPLRDPHSIMPRGDFARGEPAFGPRSELVREQPQYYPNVGPGPAMREQASFASRGEAAFAARVEPPREQAMFIPRGEYPSLGDPSLRGDPSREQHHVFPPPLMLRSELPLPPRNEQMAAGQEPLIMRREQILLPPNSSSPPGLLMGREPQVNLYSEVPLNRNEYSPTQRELLLNRRDAPPVPLYRGELPQSREELSLSRDQQVFNRGPLTTPFANRNDPVVNRGELLGPVTMRTQDYGVQHFSPNQNQMPSSHLHRQEQEPFLQQQPQQLQSPRPSEMWSDEVRREANDFFKRHESAQEVREETQRQEDSFRSRLLQQSTLPARSHDQQSPSRQFSLTPEHLRQSPLLGGRGRPDSGLSHRSTLSDRDCDFPSRMGVTVMHPPMQKPSESLYEQRLHTEVSPESARWKSQNYHHQAKENSPSSGLSYISSRDIRTLSEEEYQSLQRILENKGLFNSATSSPSERRSDSSIFRPSVGEMVTFRPSPGTAEERSLFRPITQTPPRATQGSAELHVRTTREEMEGFRSSKDVVTGTGVSQAVTQKQSSQLPQGTPMLTEGHQTPSKSLADASVQAGTHVTKAEIAVQTNDVIVSQRPLKRKREPPKKLPEAKRKIAQKYRPLQVSLFQECSERAKWLMFAAKLFMKQDPSNSVVFQNALESSLDAVADKMEEKFWAEVDKQEAAAGTEIEYTMHL